MPANVVFGACYDGFYIANVQEALQRRHRMKVIALSEALLFVQGNVIDHGTCRAATEERLFACQTEGYEPPQEEVKPEQQRIESAEGFFSSLGADIRHGGAKE